MRNLDQNLLNLLAEYNDMTFSESRNVQGEVTLIEYFWPNLGRSVGATLTRPDSITAYDAEENELAKCESEQEAMNTVCTNARITILTKMKENIEQEINSLQTKKK